jgi:hypothetical protein
LCCVEPVAPCRQDVLPGSTGARKRPHRIGRSGTPRQARLNAHPIASSSQPSSARTATLRRLDPAGVAAHRASRAGRRSPTRRREVWPTRPARQEGARPRRLHLDADAALQRTVRSPLGVQGGELLRQIADEDRGTRRR